VPDVYNEVGKGEFYSYANSFAAANISLLVQMFLVNKFIHPFSFETTTQIKNDCVFCCEISSLALNIKNCEVCYDIKIANSMLLLTQEIVKKVENTTLASIICTAMS
jgi:hypothetical protein